MECGMRKIVDILQAMADSGQERRCPFKSTAPMGSLTDCPKSLAPRDDREAGVTRPSDGGTGAPWLHLEKT